MFDIVFVTISQNSTLLRHHSSQDDQSFTPGTPQFSGPVRFLVLLRVVHRIGLGTIKNRQKIITVGQKSDKGPKKIKKSATEKTREI